MLDLIRRSMISRLLALGAVVLVTSGSQVSCSSGDTSQFEDDPLESSGPTFTSRLVLRNSAGVERYSYQQGEPITFELTVRNRTAQSVNVSLASTKVSEAEVYAAGSNDVLWHATHGQAFPQVITPLTFNANETKTFTVTWDQRLPSAAQVDRGSYEARSFVAVVGIPQNPEVAHELSSTLRAFTIN